MKWCDIPEQSVPYYTFPNLEQTGLVVSAFTTKLYRSSGKLHHHFQPLLRSSSDPEEVACCRQMLLEQWKTDKDHVVSSAQKHTANIHMVTDDDLGPEENRIPLESVDGLITDRPGVMLQTFGADCPSVYLVDPVHRAIGLCHSGRKGTQKQIASVLLQSMAESFGTKPEDVQAAISPGICRDCYEVGDEVAREFVQSYYGKTPEDPCSVLSFQDGRYHIDLPRAITDSLIAAGIPANQIDCSDLCTRCRPDRFYSFRAEGRISNENCALLMILPSAGSDSESSEISAGTPVSDS